MPKITPIMQAIYVEMLERQGKLYMKDSQHSISYIAKNITSYATIGNLKRDSIYLTYGIFDT